MKNKILTLLTACISGCFSIFGQSDSAKLIRPIEATASDYISLLKSSGYEAFPFDISFLSDGQYRIFFIVKEYKDGKEVSDNILGDWFSYNNMTLLSDFHEEDQKDTKPEDMADADRGIYTLGRKLTIGFTPAVNDSIRPYMLEVENQGSANVQLRMYPQYQNNDSINGKELYIYLTKPFKTSEFSVDKFIPLVLYGSFWYDPDFNIHRFCGENEIDPEMTADILKYIPHYYVIGIKVKKIKPVS